MYLKALGRPTVSTVFSTMIAGPLETLKSPSNARSSASRTLVRCIDYSCDTKKENLGISHRVQNNLLELPYSDENYLDTLPVRRARRVPSPSRSRNGT